MYVSFCTLSYNQLVSVYEQERGKWWCDPQLLRSGDINITFVFIIRKDKMIKAPR